MRKYLDIASQNDLKSLNLEYVGLREAARPMAAVSKNYGTGIAKDLEEKAEKLAETESVMDKLHREIEEHTVKRSEIARDSMAVRATLQQLRTE